MAVLDQFVEYRIHLYIFRIFLPILLVLGTAGNVTTITVLIKPKHHSSPTARLLLALAVSDLLVLWVVSPRFWLLGLFDFDLREVSEVVCKLHTYFSLMSGQLSVFFIVSVTLNRLVCVVQPLKAKVICSIRNTNIVLKAITAWVILTNFHFLFDIGLTEEGKCIQKEDIWNTLAMKMVLILQVTTVCFVPVLTVLVANSCMITKLVMRKRMFGTNNINNSSNSLTSAVSKKTAGITNILMLINVTFLICNIPVAVFYLVYAGKQSSYGNEREDAVVLLFWSVSLSIYLTNNAINFVLYFLSGSTFRKEVKDICCSTIHCC